MIPDAASSQPQKLPTIPEEPKKERPKIMVLAQGYRRLVHYVNLDKAKCEPINTDQIVVKVKENKKEENKND